MSSKWPKSRLSEVVEVASGQGAPQSPDDFGISGYPFIRAGSLNSLVKGASEDTCEHISVDVARKYRLRLFPQGTVLFAKSGMSATLGRVYQLEKPAYVVNHLAALIPTEFCVPSYLKYWLQVNSPSRLIQDVSYPSIRLSDISEVKIPLPPLDEQRRIAAILDKADAIRQKRQETIRLTEEFLRSVFLDMFGDPVTNPKGWSITELGQHTLKIGSGATPRGGDAAYTSSGISLIRSMNVHDGRFNYKNLAYIDENQAKQLANVEVAENDVLLNITGASVARVCRVPKNILPARVNQHVLIIRTKSSFNPLFLEQLLLSHSMKLNLLQMSGGGATREAITKAQIEKLEVIHPPINIQNNFARCIDSVDKIKLALSKSLLEFDNLFFAAQQRAFIGQL